MNPIETEDPFALRKPDWTEWQTKKTGRLWHAVALACNYDPTNFKVFHFEELCSPFNRTRPTDFEELLNLAKNNLGGKLKAVSLHKPALEESEVSFSAFHSWLRSIGYEVQPEFPGAHNKEHAITREAPLGERERTTLLTLIAALSHEAGIDITKPSKAAGLIEGLTLRIDKRIAARTIEEHLKRIPAALDK